MKVEDFRKRLKPGVEVEIEGRRYVVEQVVKWRMLRSGGFYYKYSLRGEDGDYRLAEDVEEQKFILVKIFESGVDEIEFEVEIRNKKFKFAYSEFCVIEEVWGEGEYKKGDMEVWWDYEYGEGNYLSLGNSLPGGRREDLIGRWVRVDEVSVS